MMGQTSNGRFGIVFNAGYQVITELLSNFDPFMDDLASDFATPDCDDNEVLFLSVRSMFGSKLANPLEVVPRSSVLVFTNGATPVYPLSASQTPSPVAAMTSSVSSMTFFPPQAPVVAAAPAHVAPAPVPVYYTAPVSAPVPVPVQHTVPEPVVNAQVPVPVAVLVKDAINTPAVKPTEEPLTEGATTVGSADSLSTVNSSREAPNSAISDITFAFTPGPVMRGKRVKYADTKEEEDEDDVQIVDREEEEVQPVAAESPIVEKRKRGRPKSPVAATAAAPAPVAKTAPVGKAVANDEVDVKKKVAVAGYIIADEGVDSKRSRDGKNDGKNKTNDDLT